MRGRLTIRAGLAALLKLLVSLLPGCSLWHTRKTVRETVNNTAQWPKITPLATKNILSTLRSQQNRSSTHYHTRKHCTQVRISANIQRDDTKESQKKNKAGQRKVI